MAHEAVKPTNFSEISTPHPKANYAFTNVNVVPMNEDRVLRQQTVLVRQGRIDIIGAYTKVRVPKGFIVIDGSGKYLMPGLADMHVHIGDEIRETSLPGREPLHAGVAGPEWDGAIEAELLLNLYYGVTTVRNMMGSPTTLEWRHRIRARQVLGPRLYTASFLVDGNPPSVNYPGFKVLGYPFDKPEEAPALVKELKRQGYDFIKLYQALNPPSYYALVKAARAEHLSPVGHIPFSVGIAGALKAPMDSDEHLRGYDVDPNNPPPLATSPERFNLWFKLTDAQMRNYAQATKASGMYNTPTLVGYHLEPSGAEYTARLEDRDMRFVPPELRKFMSQKSFPPGMKAPDGSDLDEAYHKWTGPVERMTMALYNAGSPLLSGTDYPYNVSMPGKGLLKELELFVQIGMTPYGALKTSTVTAQEFIRQTVESEKDMHRGVVVEGYDADLLLVEGNPLENISNVRNNVGVMVDGAWYPASEMRNRLEKLSRTWK